jgi:hypothetical protein
VVRTAQGRPPSTTVIPANRSVIWPTLYDPSQPEGGFNLAQVDTRQARFGVEYVIKDPKLLGLVVIPLRLGTFSDRQYFKDAISFDPVQYLGVTGGFGLVWRRVSLDLAYVHTRGEYNLSNVNEQPGFTESWAFDAPSEFRSNRLYVSTTLRW